MKIAVLMDDIGSINPIKDSSLAMMLEASRRGHSIYTFNSEDLFAQQGEAFAFAARTMVFDDDRHWFEKDAFVAMALTDFAVILMRKDPPFDMNYIYATYFLQLAQEQGVLVVNNPQALRDANEKLFVLNFPQCMPKTLVSANGRQIEDFINQQKTAVVKPLDGMGGNDIFKFAAGDEQLDLVLQRLTNGGKTAIMVQEFLPQIAQGDKRILLIDGKPIDYALARIPKRGSFKGNLAAGATGIGQPLSPRDYWLCQQIAPTLRAKGLLFVGLDVIGDYITEINVTSPTCLRELDAQFGMNIAGMLFDRIENNQALLD
ncbi:MAG: glutathione synthase [Candidatus Thioglobus sp.]|nr:MAG: glutathione synthase [Candidatus Thioglobus sp.]